MGPCIFNLDRAWSKVLCFGFFSSAKIVTDVKEGCWVSPEPVRSAHRNEEQNLPAI